MTKLSDLKERWMADPVFRKEYEKANAEFEVEECGVMFISQREKAIWEASHAATDVAADIAAAKATNGHDYRLGDSVPTDATERESASRDAHEDLRGFVDSARPVWATKSTRRDPDYRRDSGVGDVPSWLTRVRDAKPRGERFTIPWEPTGQPEAGNSNVTGVAGHYATLRTILDTAFAHAATGKGKERHARDLPFDRQPMLETTRMVGPGFPLGQAMKKAQEAGGMIERGEYSAAEAECLGAINYLAGCVAWVMEQSKVREAA